MTKLVIYERKLVVQVGSMISGVLYLAFSVIDNRREREREREHELASGSDSIHLHSRILVVGRGT